MDLPGLLFCLIDDLEKTAQITITPFPLHFFLRACIKRTFPPSGRHSKAVQGPLEGKERSKVLGPEVVRKRA